MVDEGCKAIAIDRGYENLVLLGRPGSWFGQVKVEKTLAAMFHLQDGRQRERLEPSRRGPTPRGRRPMEQCNKPTRAVAAKIGLTARSYQGGDQLADCWYSCRSESNDATLCCKSLSGRMQQNIRQGSRTHWPLCTSLSRLPRRLLSVFFESLFSKASIFYVGPGSIGHWCVDFARHSKAGGDEGSDSNAEVSSHETSPTRSRL